MSCLGGWLGAFKDSNMGGGGHKTCLSYVLFGLERGGAFKDSKMGGVMLA